jgi:hypothetical protein
MKAHIYMDVFGNDGLPMRYALPDVGLVYYGYLMIFILGFLPAKILRKIKLEINKDADYKKTEFYYLMYVLAVSIVPAALTADDVPNIHRSALLSIMIIFPVVWSLHRIKNPLKSTIIWIIFAVISVEFLYFAKIYVFHSADYQSIYRHDEIRSVIQYVNEHEENYDKIMMPFYQNSALYYLFSNGDFSKEYAGNFENEIYIPKIGKIEFYKEQCPSKILRERVKTSDVETKTKMLVIDGGEGVCGKPEIGDIAELDKIVAANHIEAYKIYEFNASNDRK